MWKKVYFCGHMIWELKSYNLNVFKHSSNILLVAFIGDMDRSLF